MNLAQIHPVTVEQFFRWGLFTSYQNAARVVSYLRKRKNRGLRHVGYARLSATGKPVDMYCNGWFPKPDNGRHEVLLSEFFHLYPGAHITRGPLVSRKYREDGTLETDHLYMVEMDCGTMSQAQVRARWKKYKDCEHPVLVVTEPKYETPEHRLKSLLRWSEDLKEIGYFTTLEQVLKDPYGPVWQGLDGSRYAIEKPLEEPLELAGSSSSITTPEVATA